MGESLLPTSMQPLEPGTVDESVMDVSRALSVSAGSAETFLRWFGAEVHRS